MMIFFLTLAIPRSGQAEELAIIVNAKNPADALNISEARKYLLKEQQIWPNGEKVRSVDRTGNTPERKVFLEKVVKFSANELEQFWVSKRYEKGVPVPPKFHSDQEVIEYILSFEGAIGYVNSKSITPAHRSQVKTITTVPME
jgi:ABC-type phosphate transport system substrate-binding protein